MTLLTTRRPYGAYAGIAGTFVGVLAAAGALAHLLDREREHDTLDLVLLGAATFKAARTISKEDVASFIREPFIEGGRHERAG